MSLRERLSALFGRGAAPAPVAVEKAPIPLKRAVQPRQSAAVASDQPGFSATASDQLRDTAKSSLEKARLKLRAILTPSQPVMDPKAFAGRRKLLEKVIASVEEQRLHVILYGSRGMGKTSLLHILTQRARDARYVVLYGSCGATTSFSDMFRALCSEIPLRYYGGRHAAGSPDQNLTIARLLPEGELTPRQVTEILGRLTGTRAILILDEFDRSDPGAFRQDVADLIKNLSDRATRAQLIIGGVGSNVTELIEHIPSIQRNIVGVQVQPMTGIEVRHLLKIAHDLVGLNFADDAADLIVSIAEGWPYVASLVSHHASLAAMARNSMDVERSDVVEALEDAVQEVHGRLPTDSRKEVEFVSNEATGLYLELAAKAHINFGGEFTPRNLHEISADAQVAEACGAKAEELAAEGLLFSVHQDRFGKTYSFKDSTVPLYLWLSRSQVDAPVRRQEQQDSSAAAGFAPL